MGSRSAFALAIALSTIANLSAAAPPSKEERETAHHLMDEGKERTKSGDLVRALAAYEKAHAIMHVPTTGLALARTHLALGHLVQARELARQVVAMPREPGEPAPFEPARARAKELEAQVAPRIPTLQLRGATDVRIDDQDLGKVTTASVDPGKHVVVLKSEAAEKRFEVDLAEKETKELVLEASPVAKPSPVVAPPPRPEREERSPLATGLVYGGYGLAAAGLLTASITGALALSKSRDVKDQCDAGICDPSVRGDLDGARTLATVSTIGVIALGVGVVAGTVGLFLPKKRESLVWLGPRGVEGRF